MAEADATILSYSEAFDILKGCKDPDVLQRAHRKVSPEAQALVPGAARVLGTKDLYATPKGRVFRAGGLLNIPTEMPKNLAVLKNTVVCFMRFLCLTTTHLVLLVWGPSTFNWRLALLGYAFYSLGGIVGITMGYHRLLTHKSFKTYKWLEYLIAFVGVQGGQGAPIEWVSLHRTHHMHTDTPLDPHSPYEGFWWSHILWLTGTEHSLIDYNNAADLKGQLFYRVLEEAFFPYMFILKPLVTYKLGGMAAVCWTMAFPLVLGWHTTFLVNSAAHVWGSRPYETGDMSTNNAWVSLLAFGEGWHCNHHMFPTSARHGLEWWELDPTWWLICALQSAGLVWDVQFPSEKAKALKRKKSGASPKAAAAKKK